MWNMKVFIIRNHWGHWNLTIGLPVNNTRKAFNTLSTTNSRIRDIAHNKESAAV